MKKSTLIVFAALAVQSMSGLLVAQMQPATGAQDSAIRELLAQTQNSGNTATPATEAKAKTQTAALPEKKDSSLGDTPSARQAFSGVVKGLMPMSNEQIVTLHSMLDKSKRVTALYPGVPPRETSSSLVVSLSPGSTPPVIRLRLGYISSILFIDSTGQPWPMIGYNLGNSKAFNLQWDQKNNPSTLMVQAVAGYETGNIVVMLKGLTIPVVLTFMPGQKAVDYLTYLRVPGFGPNASPQLSHLPDQANPELMSVLNGIAPVRAKPMEVMGGKAQAWLVGTTLYLRTRLTLLSPSWNATLSTPDGMHAYSLTKAPLILASDRGQMVKLTIQGL